MSSTYTPTSFPLMCLPLLMRHIKKTPHVYLECLLIVTVKLYNHIQLYRRQISCPPAYKAVRFTIFAWIFFHPVAISFRLSLYRHFASHFLRGYFGAAKGIKKTPRSRRAFLLPYVFIFDGSILHAAALLSRAEHELYIIRYDGLVLFICLPLIFIIFPFRL